MNREIKFRAWDGEQMISPDYINRQGCACWKSNSIPETTNKVMQFTGLVEKNGKEIYEGDIVNTPHNGVMKVIFLDGSFQMRMANGEKNNVITWAYNSEIIGNIYQNPELLGNVQK